MIEHLDLTDIPGSKREAAHDIAADYQLEPDIFEAKPHYRRNPDTGAGEWTVRLVWLTDGNLSHRVAS